MASLNVFGVEGILQCIRQNIEGKHKDKHQGRRRTDLPEKAVEDFRSRVTNHDSPARTRTCLNAEVQEAQNDFAFDRSNQEE